MGKTIKFRGVKNDGETVYGGAFVDPKTKHQYIIPIMDCMMPVMDNTLCQFTGCYDTNGKEIYENDIIESSYDGRQWSVTWNKGTMEYYLVLYTGNGILSTISKKLSTPSFVTDKDGNEIMMYKEYTIVEPKFS